MKGSDCSAYTDGGQNLYSTDCATIGSGCTIYLNSGCSTLANGYCFNDGGSYWCTNGSGVVTSTGGCTT
jgi:hypothetical protein